MPGFLSAWLPGCLAARRGLGGLMDLPAQHLRQEAVTGAPGILCLSLPPFLFFISLSPSLSPSIHPSPS